MARQRVSVEELLLRHRAIDEDQLRSAKDQQKKTGGDLGQILVELGYVSEELLLRAQANQLGIPLVNLMATPPPPELAQALTEQICKRFGVIPVGGNLETKLLRVATSQPGNAGRLTQIADATGFRIEAAAATSESIEKAIRKVFSGQGMEDPFADEPGAGMHSELHAELHSELHSELHPEVHPEPDELGDLRERLAALETMLSNPQFAAILARVERLEQIAEKDHHALNVLFQVVIELGLITREDLKQRLAKT